MLSLLSSEAPIHVVQEQSPRIPEAARRSLFDSTVRTDRRVVRIAASGYFPTEETLAGAWHLCKPHWI
ncbi:MAG: hypothetical protein R3C17_12400 [Planctomycetaceae bacterium]